MYSYVFFYVFLSILIPQSEGTSVGVLAESVKGLGLVSTVKLVAVAGRGCGVPGARTSKTQKYMCFFNILNVSTSISFIKSTFSPSNLDFDGMF